MIRTGKDRSNRRKIDPSATVFTSNSIYTGLGWNPGLRGESLATNLLSRGTVIENYRLNTKKGGCYTMYNLQFLFFSLSSLARKN
jgi:hypothetical protein